MLQPRVHFIGYACVAVCLIAVVFAGCARIPREAPALSAELGSRIAAIEGAHLSLLHKFFDERRTLIESFVLEEWAPEFQATFFANPEIDKTWQAVVRSGSKEDRQKFLLVVIPKLENQISVKRTELLTALDDVERTIERRIRSDYREAQAINNSITSFLASASSVAENRDRYLKLVGVTDETMTVAIDRIDGVVGSLCAGAESIADKEQVARKCVERLNAIRESLRK
jgi:hypothetical protein